MPRSIQQEYENFYVQQERERTRAAAAASAANSPAKRGGKKPKKSKMKGGTGARDAKQTSLYVAFNKPGGGKSWANSYQPAPVPISAPIPVPVVIAEDALEQVEEVEEKKEEQVEEVEEKKGLMQTADGHGDGMKKNEEVVRHKIEMMGVIMYDQEDGVAEEGAGGGGDSEDLGYLDTATDEELDGGMAHGNADLGKDEEEEGGLREEFKMDDPRAVHEKEEIHPGHSLLHGDPNAQIGAADTVDDGDEEEGWEEDVRVSDVIATIRHWLHEVPDEITAEHIRTLTTFLLRAVAHARLPLATALLSFLRRHALDSAPRWVAAFNSVHEATQKAVTSSFGGRLAVPPLPV
jgi:hypothetical protein